MSNTANQNQLWTIDQAGQFLNVCRSHIYKLIRTDPAFPRPLRLGTSIRFKPADFDRYVAEKSEHASTH